MAFIYLTDLYDLFVFVCKWSTAAKRIKLLSRPITARWSDSGQMYVISMEFWWVNRRRLFRKTSPATWSCIRRLLSRYFFCQFCTYMNINIYKPTATNSPVLPAGVPSLNSMNTSGLSDCFALFARQRINCLVSGFGFSKESSFKQSLSWSTTSLELHCCDISVSMVLLGSARTFSSIPAEAMIFKLLSLRPIKKGTGTL